MRQILAGLVLAAVLAMHGVPLLSVGGGADGDALASNHVMALAAPVAEVAEDGAGFTSMPTVLPFDLQSERAHGVPAMPDRGSHMHMWAACLAVLLAGLTLLVSAALLRRAEVTPAGSACARPRWPRGWARMPRPPDLFALCLLRT